MTSPNGIKVVNKKCPADWAGIFYRCIFLLQKRNNRAIMYALPKMTTHQITDIHHGCEYTIKNGYGPTSSPIRFKNIVTMAYRNVKLSAAQACCFLRLCFSKKTKEIIQSSGQIVWWYSIECMVNNCQSVYFVVQDKIVITTINVRVTDVTAAYLIKCTYGSNLLLCPSIFHIEKQMNKIEASRASALLSCV